MATGTPYFAWIDAGEIVFLDGHKRWDENVASFVCKQDEGDPASLTIVVRRPRNEGGDPIGLLGPGRKIWAWFAIDCSGGQLFKIRGRLVGIPTSIFEELVTLEFVARPFDVVEQKRVLADTLRVLPYYDEAMISKERRDDPEVVLEAYTAIWHYDRETLLITISDEISGEDGLVAFDGESEAGKVMWDGLKLTLAQGPLSRVDVKAEFNWTQQAVGTVDLTKYLMNAYPNEFDFKNVWTSFTLKADSWPKNGTGIGEGWTASAATASDVYNLEVKTTQQNATVTQKWDDGDTSTTTTNESIASVLVPLGSISVQKVVTKDSTDAKWAKGEESFFGPLLYNSSVTRNYSDVHGIVPLYHVRATLLAAFKAERPCKEILEFSLIADVQSIMTNPQDGEALQLDDLKSVNLNEVIGVGTGAYIPMVDARRRSYIATERGNRSIEYCIAMARSHLLKRSRVVEIAFVPKLERMPEITLRKDVSLIEPRVGEAIGKIIGYSLALDGDDGQIKCEVKIGCTIGRGGSISPEDGNPSYCEIEYCGHDYQVFTDRVVVVFDTSVGYGPPVSNPNDDGIEFLSLLTAADVMQVPLAVENPPAVQRLHIAGNIFWPDSQLGMRGVTEEDVTKALEKRKEKITNAIKQVPTNATFKLKSMARAFETPYDLEITDLKIPTGYDLEAV